MRNQGVKGASPVATGLAGAEAPEPHSRLGSSSGIPSAANRAIATLAELTGVYDGAPPVAVYPYAQVQFAAHSFGEDSLLAVTIWDNEPTRAHHLGDAVESAVRDAPFVSRLLRRRVVRDVAGPWACVIDFRVKESKPHSEVTISGELYAFLMGEGPLEGVWFGDMNEGFRGAFWWRALLRCAAGWPASGTSGSAQDAQRLDPEGAGPTPAGGDAQPSGGFTQ